MKIKAMKPDPDARIVYGILIAFFGTIILANATLFYLAWKSEDGLVETDYYRKGLNYQLTRDNKANSQKLGWKVDLQTLSKGKTTKCILNATDNNLQLIKGANIKLTFFRPTKSGFDQSLTLTEIKPGEYQSDISLPLSGLWDVIINIQRGNDQWQNKQRIRTNT